MTGLFRRIGSLLLITALLALQSGCKEAGVPNETPVEHTIMVCAETGEALEDIKVFVYEDDSCSELVCVDTTDAEGCVSFLEKPLGSYVAVLKEVPTGYSFEEQYALVRGTTKLTLFDRELTPEEMAQVRYALGDRLADFTVTDCDGNAHTLSQLLERNKAVVLNFWFLNCEPCKLEFPYLQQAYEAYGEEAAFLALNPVDGTDATVQTYRQEQQLTFPMASCSPAFQDMLGLKAYPTTVIVDRHGYVCLSHTGMFTDSAGIMNALAYFTQDTYEQQFFETIEDIPVVS